MTSPAAGQGTPIQRGVGVPAPLRVVIVFVLLYLFLVGVKLLESGINGLGADVHETLFDGVSNPLAALFVGILATVLVQSSSVTTATIVGLVASGVITVDSAVPMVMGANIGTTVTNTIVALGHVRHSEDFKRAFAGATMHDFFNLLSVIIILPLELLTGFLSEAASKISTAISGQDQLSGSFDSPIKGAVKWLAGIIEDLVEGAAQGDVVIATILIAIGLGFIFRTLTYITKNMKVLVATRIERSLNAALAKRGAVAMIIGVIVTIAVQSSSITTSILVPLIASGILLIDNAYPITLGANIGTTVTALLAALGAGKVDGLTIAVVHTLFNVAGILLLYPSKRIRRIPITLAEALADIATRNRALAGVYVIGIFVIVPLAGILILR